MKNVSFATLGTLALLAAASAFGSQRGTFDVPFEFSFAGMVMPAGQYNVICDPGLLTVSNSTTRTALFATTLPVGGSGNSEISQVRLTFNKYGDQYFLAEAWLQPGSDSGIAIVKSKAERELSRMTPTVSRVTLPARSGIAAIAAAK